VRGITTTLTIGERVAWYRRRRGLSQEALAGLVGRTADWLGKIENNRIELDRLSVIKALADVLDVSLGDLLAEPSLMDWSRDSGNQTVPALRAALADYRAITPLGRDPSSVDLPCTLTLRRDVDALWRAYQDSRFGYVTGRLPELLGRAQLAVEGLDGEDQEQARRLLGLAYQLAATQLTKLGEADLAWIAADRGLTAIRPTGDPMVTGSFSARSVTPCTPRVAIRRRFVSLRTPLPTSNRTYAIRRQPSCRSTAPCSWQVRWLPPGPTTERRLALS
jgi:transcriptional regulator with XRE-family HTH domain